MTRRSCLQEAEVLSCQMAKALTPRRVAIPEAVWPAP